MVNMRPAVAVAIVALSPTAEAWSSFHGSSLSIPTGQTNVQTLTMRKQKASDRRTRRMQRGIVEDEADAAAAAAAASLSSHGVTAPPLPTRAGATASPMAAAAWRHRSVNPARKVRNAFPAGDRGNKGGGGGGRGRSRKRSATYQQLATYQNEFVNMLTAEYRVEEAEVLGRIEASVDDPLGLEAAGHALFDMYPERRGNIFSDEVYRLTKSFDATTVFRRAGYESSDDRQQQDWDGGGASAARHLPPNHKFASNDVLMLTLQPAGSGDFFGSSSLPTSKDAVSVEARVLSTGPTYVDIALPGGAFEAAFGPAPNNIGSAGRGDPKMRLRADRFFSNVPYTRMVAALSQMTALPEKPAKQQQGKSGGSAGGATNDKQKEAEIHLDEVIREAIVSTYGYADPSSPLHMDADACDLDGLARKLARPPLPNSVQLANQALAFMQSGKTDIFPPFNEPQLTAIGAALTRRMTMIQGPPGTGKTTVAASIAFGFVHQCRSVSPHTKVLACAFSNVGADNLAEQLIRLGLKVVRVGKPSGVSQSLWDYTLDAAIDNDPAARKALDDAARATSNLKQRDSKQSSKKGSSQTKKKGGIASARSRIEAATRAVKASVQACNVAATKALREADVIVCTSVGAADSRLLAACGIVSDEDDEMETDGRFKSAGGEAKAMSNQGTPINGATGRRNAPDNLPPLSTPFVVVDEACQSVEPANLIPLTATNSCRSLVMLGDPCQLPPTVRGDISGTSPLSVSLMSRLASTLHHPVIVTARPDKTEREETYLNALPTKQAVSLVRYKSRQQKAHVPYRKQFSGSLLLSVQYRMHPSISAFPSMVFYDGLLSTPAFLADHRAFPQALAAQLPTDNSDVGVRFINVGGRNNERRGERLFASPSLGSTSVPGENTSYRNEAEAEAIVDLLKELLRSSRVSDSFPKSIGIVTPYTSQVALLKSLMASDSEFRSMAKELPSVIEAQSVDGYQGRERDLIIFSAVRSNRFGKLGFLTDWRRMNVALTRAKSGLIVLGDMETLKADRHWEAFVNWCEGVGCITDNSLALQ